MKILETRSLKIEEVKIFKYARFKDERGYFTETFRKSDMAGFLGSGAEILQANESYSKPKVLRGLHFQWSPYMGKLVRPLNCRLIDLALDIRKNSKTFGKIVAAELIGSLENEYGEWIWVPPGFAHGIYLPEGGLVEYMCTGDYSPGNEAGIHPLSEDIDWSLCEEKIYNEFQREKNNFIISAKDKLGLSIGDWQKDPRSENFL
ncbi:MAG: dTDP-4-dehydrorhamnose 3,5-epimerase family protein [Candidatus Doudnabacteria bacterium]|nr:dTDP-4-dehydrorhamnose 3,5-epimerase family protein [Candidatus Doudnabacteria bacterium]